MLVSRIEELSGSDLVKLIEKFFNEMVAEVRAKLNVSIDVNQYFKPEKRFDINDPASSVSAYSEDKEYVNGTTGSDSSDLDNIYRRFVYTLQNRTGMAGVRKYAGVDYYKKTDNLGAALFGFNPHSVVFNYKSEDDLYKAFQRYIPELRTRALKTKGNDPWRIFCKGALSGARFFASLKTKDNLKSMFDKFMPQEDPTKDDFLGITSKDFYEMSALPAMLALHIEGIQFTLACDFLKEIGYDFPKPDVHVMDVFREYLKKPAMPEIDVWTYLIDYARFNNMTAYKLDKMIWVVCTGGFYLDDIKIQGRKMELLNDIKTMVTLVP